MKQGSARRYWDAEAQTLEEHRRSQDLPVPAPQRGSELLERIVVNDDISWKKHGACSTDAAKGVDFFPSPDRYGPAGFHNMQRKAKAVCEDCPVTAECLAYAERNHEYGIWGGSTEKDRRLPAIPRKRTGSQDKQRGPVSAAILNALADGDWHNYDDITARCAHTIADDQVRRRVNARRAQRGARELAVISRTEDQQMRRLIIIENCTNLKKRSMIVLDRGRVSLTTFGHQAVAG